MKIWIFMLMFAMLLSYPSLAQQNTCDYKIEILLDGSEFEKSDFKWRMQATKIEGKSTNITGTAEIEDSNGKTVKKYKPWTSDSISRQKTSSQYSPNLNPGDYKITAEISVDCDDTNKNNNVDAKDIKIKGDKEETKIKKSKSSDENLGTGNGAVKIQNLTDEANKEDTPSIPDAISSISKKSEIKLNNEKNQAPALTADAIQKPYIVYESSNEKAKELILILLLVFSVTLNIILIWRR